MDSTQGFHAIMSVFLMPMWLLSGAFFPVPPWHAGMGWPQAALAWVMFFNPLTYGVAGLRQLMYSHAAANVLPADTPALAVCWVVVIAFAAVTFALSWKIAGQRTTG